MGRLIAAPYIQVDLRLLRPGYQSQTDGLQALCGSSFLLFASPSSRRLIVGLPNRRNDKMPVGKVKFFNQDKGYGFIAPEDGGTDAFVHITAVERAGLRTLQQDQRVSYELEQDRRGKTSAVNLQAL